MIKTWMLCRQFRSALLSFLVLLLLPLSSLAKDQTEVRVRMQSSLKSLLLRGEALVLKKDKYTRSLDQNQIRIKREQSSQGQWQWSVESAAQQGGSLQVVASSDLEILSQVPILSQVDGLPRQIKLVAEPGKASFHVIAMYELSEYLAGVVAAEMPLAWPVEALKAQLVAARSYTLSVMKHRQKRAWDVEKGVQDQAFDPSYDTKIPAVYVERLQRAVAETRGEYLTPGSGGLAIKAYYHAQCGGQTQSPRAKWGHGPDWGHAKDPHCATAKVGSWTYKITKQALEDRLKAGRLLPQTDRFLALNLKLGDKSGRVEEVEFQLPKKSKAVKGYDLRRVMGYSEIKSTKFEMIQEGESLTFRGQGYGHGVGLCQWGAKHLAQNGADYKSILRHYYPQAQIIRLESSSL